MIKQILLGIRQTAMQFDFKGTEERHEPLYLLPPQDGITKLAGTFSAPLYLVLGNIYGLAKAPRTCCRHVI